MDRIDCLICSCLTESKPARIAPFLSHYCELGTSLTKIRYCGQCDLAFFQRRLTDDEAKRLYTNYRGEEYNRERLKLEPGYERFMGPFEDPLSFIYTERIRDYVDFIDVFPEIESARHILDFGGDGSIPKRVFPGARIAIDDLSAGSTETNATQYDLVFASNVFEHISDPAPVLKKLVERIEPEGMLFIDVPGHAQASLRESILWQEKHGGELFEMHEHITHFSKRSLRLLVEAAGMTVLFEYRARHGGLTAIAAFPESGVTKRLLPEKNIRHAHFESKIARAEARAAHDATWSASASAANRLTENFDKAIKNTDSQLALIQQNNREVDLFHKQECGRLQDELAQLRLSTSWKITAPLRFVKTNLFSFLK